MAYTPAQTMLGKPDRRVAAWLMSGVALAFGLVSSSAAQAPAHGVASAPAAQPAPVPAPAVPNWPANQAPTPATVHWDSHGLHVSAANSSLRQILTEVSTLTGAKLEGLATDERVFGEYGPGPAREVLGQLLHGSAYNIMLIGDQGQGTPREIVLSARNTASAAPVRAPQPVQQDSDEDVEPEPPQQPQEAQPVQPPPPNAAQPPSAPPMNPGQQRGPMQPNSQQF